MPSRTHILCSTDILCRHSYFAHARFEQIAAGFRDQVQLSYHFRPT